ncbi:MAG: hypothetical protein K9K76_01205 [Halanaerobiales bacterium]|nr:hypothetical protein [Halanaerobiales bacterium]
MGREISLFSNYHSQENNVTNYCGLILKLLYEEDPNSFEEVLASLVESDISLTVGPKFSQQKKIKKSIPDLAITQNPFSVFFETKLDDWFYTEQIENHIEGFQESTDLKVLFLLANFETEDFDKRFEEEIKKAKKEGIILQPITFEEFVDALENIDYSMQFKKMLEEFKGYLDRNDYLPKWKYLLDVVNCSNTMNEINENVYMCPDSGGAYSHRRAKYFGPYSNKTVSKIFEIDAVVVVDKDFSDYSIKWNNSKKDKDELYSRAKKKIKKFDNRIEEIKSYALQVFLLSNPADTDFYKSTSGGMMQSKKYFWDVAVDCKDSKELAKKLDGVAWKDIE